MKQKKLPITFQGTLRLRNTNQISFWSTNSRENSSSVLGQTRCTTVHQFISHRGQDRYTKKEKALMTFKKTHGEKRYHSNIIQRGTSFQQPQHSPSLEGGASDFPLWLLLFLLEGDHPLARDFSSSSMELLGSVVCLLVGKSPLIANRPIDYKLMDWLTNGC